MPRHCPDGALRQLLERVLGNESDRFLEGAGQLLPPTFRFNPLKHTLEFQQGLLTRQGFSFSVVDGVPNAYRVGDEPFPLGCSLSHFAGHIYLQNLSSMAPVRVLNPRPAEKVLDLCAAPGSKTTQLAVWMENRGAVVANEVSLRRIRVLVANLQRMGVTNVAVQQGFGEQCGNQFFEVFDRVLVDPPCSALGTLHKSPEVLSWWRPERTAKLARIQKNLLHSGLKALRPGGVLTYSTCTITPQENEEVVQFALDTLPVELEEISISGMHIRPPLSGWGGDRYHPQMSRAVRIYPFESRSEGFFIARIRKLESFGQQRRLFSANETAFKSAGEYPVEQHLSQLSSRYDIADDFWRKYTFLVKANLFCASWELASLGERSCFKTAGLPIAHIGRGQLKITTEGAHLLSSHLRNYAYELKDFRSLQDYLNRNEVTVNLADTHQVPVSHAGQVLGHGIVDSGRLLSRFPRAGWEFELC